MEKKIKSARFTCWDGTFTEVYPIEIRSIEAWRDENGWSHNNSFVLYQEQTKTMLLHPEITNRKLFQFLREMGILTENSKGKVRVEDRWPYIEIQDKNTYEPLIQIYFDEDNKKELYV